MAGLTDAGFEAKRLADVIADAEIELATIVDPVSGETLQPDFTSDDPAMQIALVPLDAVSVNWEATQLVFDQFDPSKATGPSLSALMQLNGIERLDAAPSTVTLILTGTIGQTVPAGQLVSDEFDRNQWRTLDAVTFDGFGSGTADAECQTLGPIAAAAGTLTKIVTPQPGWSAVTNAAPATVGRNIETDAEARLRQTFSTLAPASAPAEAVYANLLNVPGVTYARVLINKELVTDSRGIPAKHQAAVVVGGDDTEIAKVILARSGATAEFFGDVVVTLFDLQGEPYPVKFIRPTGVNIFVNVEIEVYNAGVFPSNGADLIKEAIVAYAAGGAPALGIDDGFNDLGFPPGSDIIRTRLFTPINSVPGHRVTLLEIGAPALAENDIPIAFDEVGAFSVGNITVTLT